MTKMALPSARTWAQLARERSMTSRSAEDLRAHVVGHDLEAAVGVQRSMKPRIGGMKSSRSG
jgi:hypothetical protein